MPRWQEYMKLGDLRANTQNPKDHDTAGISASMTRFGYIEPVTIDERDGTLISGHGRIETLVAAKAAGREPPDEDIIVDDDGDWTVPVNRGWSSKNEIEQKGALIALNKWVEAGGWHERTLADLLQSISDSPFGLDGVGVDRNELDDLLATLAGPPDLDELLDRLDPPTEEEFWPVLRFRIPPKLRERYLALVSGVDGGESEQFAHLVDLAEKA